jgi:hypothetical protein
MVKVWKLDSGLVEEDSFILDFVFIFFFFEAIVKVNSSDFGVSIDLRSWSFFGVLVGR